MNVTQPVALVKEVLAAVKEFDSDESWDKAATADEAEQASDTNASPSKLVEELGENAEVSDTVVGIEIFAHYHGIF